MPYNSDSDCSCSGCEAGRNCDSLGMAHQNECHRTLGYQEQQRLRLNSFDSSYICPRCGIDMGHDEYFDSSHQCYDQQPSWQPSSTAGYVLPSGVGYANSTRGVPESHMPANSSYFPSRIQHPQASSSTGYAYPVQSNLGGSVRQSRSTTRVDTPPARSRSLSESSERSSSSGDSGDLITDIGRLTP